VGPQKTRVLFVDDEPTIRLTLPKILEMHEFEVKAAANVPDALKLIQDEQFDVLLTDLNIGAPSDGFTVVSAMRRCQPEAVTIIITGYPAFESALQAIRDQVDDYISKPANVDELISRIKDKVQHRTRHVLEPQRRAYRVLNTHREEILTNYVKALRNSSLPVSDLSEAEIRNSMPKLLDHLIRDMETSGKTLEPEATKTAREHGRTRLIHGFKAVDLIEETRLFRTVVYDKLEHELLGLDTSTLIPDIVRMGNFLFARLGESLGSYLEDNHDRKKPKKKFARATRAPRLRAS